MRNDVTLLVVCLAGCAGGGVPHGRSASAVVSGPDCRAACMAQLHGGEVVADCTPPIEFDPHRRDPWTTVCFFDPKK